MNHVKERKGQYRGVPYWEQETPREAATSRVWLSWFEQAGKLQIAVVYRDRKTGEAMRGQTVTLDVQDMADHPEVLDLLTACLAQARQESVSMPSGSL